MTPSLDPAPAFRSRFPAFETLRARLATVLVVALAAVAPLAAQEKPPVTVDDYDPWKRIGSVELSNDGQWMTYAYAPIGEGDDTLFVRDLDEAESEAHRVPRGGSASFSPDARWVGYLVSPEGSGDDGGGQGNGGPGRASGRNGNDGRTLVLRDLATGDSTTFANVQSFSFPENTDLLLLRKRGPGRDADYDGADLVVHTLSSGASLNLGNVSDYGVNEPGSHLAYLVDAQDDAGNGLYLLDLATNGVTPVDTRAATYSELRWNEDGDQLAALRGEVPEEMAERANTLLVLRDLSAPRAAQRMDPAEVAGFPDGFVLSERGGLRWSEDGTRLFVGIKEQHAEREELEDRANVDVWHWDDVEVQSVQQVRAGRNRNFTWDAVVNLRDDGLAFVRLADEELESVDEAGDSRWAIGRDPTPYEYEIAWGGSDADYYRVDLDTGERTPIAERVGRQMGTSIDGRWWLFLRDERVIAHDLETGDEVDLTESSGVDFIDRLDDHPYELPIHGVAGWSDDGESVLLYDRYDVWQVPLDGSEATNLTQGVGAAEQIRFRVSEFRESGGGGGFGISRSRPFCRATQSRLSGHVSHRGLSVQTLLPNSITAWLNVPTFFRGRIDSATDHRYRCVAAEPVGSRHAVSRASTRVEFASRMGCRASREIERTAPAVYFPTPGSASTSSISCGNSPPCRSTITWAAL